MRADRIAPVLVMFAVAGACGGNDQSATVSGNTGGSFNPTGAGGSFNPGAGGFGAGNPGGGSSPVDPDAACATTTATTSLSALTMFVMMDDSGSMNDNNKWNQAAAAMKTFFADPASAGLRVGLRLFPSNTPTTGCWDTVCNMNQNTAITACSTPLVDIGQLSMAAAPADTQEAALLAAIPANPQPKGGGNSGGTPTYAALQGAVNIVVPYQASHPKEKVVIVFVTDGDPNGCDENIGDIAMIASDAFATNNIPTYVIGVPGATTANLDRIAAAGGTMKSITVGGTNAAATEQDLLAAFTNIQKTNVGCDFTVPAPPAGETFSNANVNYTPGGGTLTTLPRVSVETSCGTSGGWYYDNNTAPKMIHLCPTTCTTVQADTGASLQVLFACGIDNNPTK